MPLPTVSRWDETRQRLHQALQIVSAVRLAGVDPMPNELQFSTWPARSGVTTGPLKFGGSLDFDYTHGSISYQHEGETLFSVDIGGHSQVSLADAVFTALASVGHSLTPTRKRITESASLKLNGDDARAFAENPVAHVSRPGRTQSPYVRPAVTAGPLDARLRSLDPLVRRWHGRK